MQGTCEYHYEPERQSLYISREQDWLLLARSYGYKDRPGCSLERIDAGDVAAKPRLVLVVLLPQRFVLQYLSAPIVGVFVEDH
jgi:hypothetical protein